MKTEEFMKEKYINLSMVEKLEYWDYELNFQHRMQCEAAEGIGNIALYLINKSSKKYLQQYEKDWNLFEKEFCTKHRIDLKIGQRLFDLDYKEKPWRELALKVGLNPKYPH